MRQQLTSCPRDPCLAALFRGKARWLGLSCLPVRWETARGTRYNGVGAAGRGIARTRLGRWISSVMGVCRSRSAEVSPCRSWGETKVSEADDGACD